MNISSRLFCSFLLSVLVVFPILLYAELWDSGPTAPFTPTLLYSGGDGQILLARASYSSAWLSRDGGYYWQCLDQDLKEVNNTSYSSVHPYMINDSSYVFFCDSRESGSAGHQIIATFDFGESFVDRSPGSWPNNINTNSFTVHSENDDCWMIQTDLNVYFTENAGENWFVSSSIPDDGYYTHMNGLYCDPLDSDTYYSITHYNDYEAEPEQRFTRIYRTIQGPNSWITNIPFIDTSVDLESTVIAITEFLPLSNDEFISTAWTYPADPSWDADHLVTFDQHGDYATRSGGDLKFERLYFEDNTQPGRIYGRVENSVDIYVSNDYGMTWSVLETTGLPEIEYFHLNSFCQAENSSALYISIEDVGLYKSEDHGVNWELMETFDWSRFFTVYPHSEDIYYADWDTKWYQQGEPGSEITTLGISNPDSIYGHGEIYYANGDTILGPMIVYPMTDHYNYRLYRTFDAGQNWDIITDLNTKSVKPFFDPGTEDFYLFASSSEEYSISRDFGDSWTSILDPREEIESIDIRISCFNRDRIYAYGRPDVYSDFEVYELILENNEWVNINYPDSSGSTPHLLAVPRGVYSFGWDRNVYRYSGGRWETYGQIPESVEIPRFSKFLYNDPFAIIAYNDNGSEVIFSRDDGYTWRVLDLCLPGGASIGRITGFEQDIHRHRIWVETNLGIFWYNLEDFLDAEEGKLELNPVDFNLLTAYPNPFNASTRITYNLKQAGNVKLDIYDITGRLVKTMKSTYQPAGTQSVFLDGSGLASGTYFIRLDTGREIRNRKITLVK